MADEAERIAAEYRRRDAARGAEPGLIDPAQQLYLQELEWALVCALRAADVRLAGVAVLDVGTGSGMLLHRLADLGAARAVGLDLMPERIEAARARYPALELVAGNAVDLPFADGEFDLVTHFTCLSSILEPEMRRRVAAEMWRVARPGGVVLSYDLRPAPAPIRGAGALLRRRAAAPLWTPVRPLDRDEVRSLFPGTPVAERSVTLNPSLPAPLRSRRGPALALAAVPALRSHWLAVIRKPDGGRA